MSLAFLITFAASAVAILALAGLAAWARIERPTRDLNEAEVLRLLSEEHPGWTPERVILSLDRKTAIARRGDAALILFRMGDGHVTRTASWDEIAALKPGAAGLALRLGDPWGGAVRFRVPDNAPWPPGANGAAL